MDTKSDNTIQHDKQSDKQTDKQTNLQEVMKDIENRVNPKSLQEGVKLLAEPAKLESIIQSAFTEFQSKVGRPMTYSEMREMMG
jgi:hypothetical protein